MTSRSPVVVAAVASALLLSGCGGSRSSSTSAPAPAPTMTAGHPLSGSTPRPATSTVAGGGSAAATSSPAPAQVSASAPRPGTHGTVSVPAAGEYAYRSTDANGTSTAVTLNVRTRQVGGVPIVTTTLSDQGGQGDQTTRLRWQRTAIAVSDIQFVESNCHWTPPVTALTLPVKVGARWPIDSRCVVSVNGTTAHVRAVGSGVVAKSGSSTVDGKSVKGWWLRTTLTLTVDFDGAQGAQHVTDDSRVESLLLPSYGINAIQKQHDTWRTGPTSRTTTRTLRLLHLTPN